MYHGFKGFDETPVKYDQKLLAMDCHQNEREQNYQNSKKVKRPRTFFIITPGL